MNYYIRGGEIDIIATIHDLIVFFEVKSRSCETHGTPAEAVTKQKSNRMIKTAMHFITQEKIFDRMIRFDVIEINTDMKYFQGDEPHFMINHIENAFEYYGRLGF